MSRRAYKVDLSCQKEDFTFSLINAWEAIEPYINNCNHGFSFQLDTFDSVFSPPMLLDIKAIREDLSKSKKHAVEHKEQLERILADMSPDEKWAVFEIV
jgi:hypothetical protein